MSTKLYLHCGYTGCTRVPHPSTSRATQRLSHWFACRGCRLHASFYQRCKMRESEHLFWRWMQGHPEREFYHKRFVFHMWVDDATIKIEAIGVGLSAAFNYTRFPPPKRAEKRQDAPEVHTHWTLSFNCPVEWSQVETVYGETPYILNGCGLTTEGRSMKKTLLRVTCIYAFENPATFPSLLLQTVRTLLLGVNTSTSNCTSGPHYGIVPDRPSKTTGPVKKKQATPTPITRVMEASGGVQTQAGAGWALDRIDQRVGRDSRFSYLYQGTGVIVYSLDTGLYAHVNFGGRASTWLDLVDPACNCDCNGHGTETAGCVGSAGYGVAKNVTLRGIRVLDCDGNGYMSDVILGIMAVMDAQDAGAHAAVVTMSLTGPGDSMLDSYATSLVTDYKLGVLAAAGNSADNACSYSPARAPAILTVGASDITDRLTWFSNRGTCVDLLAPGDAVCSVTRTGGVSCALAGTSFSAPYVGGYLAQLAEARLPLIRGDLDMAQLLSEARGTGSIRISGYPLLFTGTGLPPPPPPPPAPPLPPGSLQQPGAPPLGKGNNKAAPWWQEESDPSLVKTAGMVEHNPGRWEWQLLATVVLVYACFL